ncbi:MAG TPA: type I restriction endonuclease [Bacillota bacterium]|nr:type I restriction endonuclease [Bacillota bacterium]
MEFAEKLSQFAQRVESLKGSITTEEATKTSLIMPFFQMLGYDVFNPLEFVPEFTADVGIKKGEKVDYAIMVDNIPLILIECKPCFENLDKHDSQLFRYFGTTASKFAILTNGIIYRFFTDLEDKNKMDSTPFLEFDILNLKENLVPEVKKFSKEMLDVDTILGAASELKYTRLIKEWFLCQLEEPTIDLVRLIMSSTYDGLKNQKAIDKFQPLVKRSFKQFLSDTMNDRIKSALRKEHDDVPGETAVLVDAPAPEEDIIKINTTMEEFEAFAIVKSIIRGICDISKVFYRDTESYFGILYEDNNRKWICRAHLNGNNKYITIPDDNKKSIRYDIETLDDIYKYSDQIIESCRRYL